MNKLQKALDATKLVKPNLFIKRIIKKFKGKGISYFAKKQTTHLFPLTAIVTSVVFTTPLVVSVNTISSSQKERNLF